MRSKRGDDCTRDAANRTLQTADCTELAVLIRKARDNLPFQRFQAVSNLHALRIQLHIQRSRIRSKTADFLNLIRVDGHIVSSLAHTGNHNSLHRIEF